MIPFDEFIKRYKPNNIEFVVDIWEQMVLEELMAFDERTAKKLSRDVTTDFIKWLDDKVRTKKPIKLNCKGSVRSGKSLTGLKIGKKITDKYADKEFKIDKIVCGNQQEYRVKLHKAEFGDFYLVDENAFTNVGMGMASEMFQLKDINNIIAKQNIHTIFITPESFINNNSEIGLASWGNDINNWVSRFLVYSLKGSPILLGYIVIDIGELFIDCGCYVFKEIGGCTNPNRFKFEDISKEAIEYSSCLKGVLDNSKTSLRTDGQVCPFYDICKSEMCAYEHKKDSWIEKEMKGGLNDRQKELYRTCLKLVQKLARRNPTTPDKLMFFVKSAKELKEKINFYTPKVSNTKYTLAEKDSIFNNIHLLIDKEFFDEVMKELELNAEEEWDKIEALQ